MGLQTQSLVMVGLHAKDDKPATEFARPLVDGNHLRWAARPELGFPWWGYLLFRRKHIPGNPICLASLLLKLDYQPGTVQGKNLDTDWGRLSSDQDLKLVDQFPPSGHLEFDLEHRRWLRFDFVQDEPARSVTLTIGFVHEGKVEIETYSGRQVIDKITLSGSAWEQVKHTVQFDLITAVRINSGPAVLVDLCFVPVSQNAAVGWERVPSCQYPITLPIRHPDYPCWQGPEDSGAAETVALSRIRYGDRSYWQGDNFKELYEQLLYLVSGGPGSQPMYERSVVQPEELDPLVSDPPEMPEQRPLDLVLLGSLHPSVAQMVGLYWVDTDLEPDTTYDYLIITAYNHFEVVMGDLLKQQLLAPHAYIVFNLGGQKTTELQPPENIRSFSLPGAVAADGKDETGAVGLTWDRAGFAPGSVISHGSVLYHVWRADLGDRKPTSVPSIEQFTPITKEHPIAVMMDSEPGAQRSPEWPPFPLVCIDGGLKDGWYSYRLSGIDIFGRHSQLSCPGRWFQWHPQPEPKPWYYQLPAGTRVIHDAAVHVLDKLGPPAPVGVEAYVLDPDDPVLIRDEVYSNWWNSLPSDQRDQIIGLRVSWKWTYDQMIQAPDTAEFRIYYHDGTDAPTAPDKPENWQRRFHVVRYNESYVTSDGGKVRHYEVLLPVSASDPQVPLSPTLAQPVVYANVGVAAADHRTHTDDHAKWGGTRWGDRRGNEGPMSPPCRIYRVRRVAPDPPVPPPDSDRVYATAADYHGKSYYTYRWVPQQYLRTHVFRALDEAVFQIDWTRRCQGTVTVDPTDNSIFPTAAVEPRWDSQKRQQVATEIDYLNTIPKTSTGKQQALTYYRSLSNDALRVLAGLPGNENAFTQVTIEPLDPGDPDTANRLGPDDPADKVIDPAVRMYIDTLDGGSTNRYFYRAAYVDGAHNRSSFSLSGPPVWLPNVVPPRTPVITGVRAGDCEITISWASNREDDLDCYQVFRANSATDARDLRMMTLVHTESVGDTARPAEVSWTDSPVPGLVDLWYRLVAVDDAGNISKPTDPVLARAVDESPPVPPVPTVAWVEKHGKQLAEISWSSSDETLLQRRAGGLWVDLGSWRAPGSHDVTDPLSEADSEQQYRLWAKKQTGAIAKGSAVTLAAQ